MITSFPSSSSPHHPFQEHSSDDRENVGKNVRTIFASYITCTQSKMVHKKCAVPDRLSPLAHVSTFQCLSVPLFQRPKPGTQCHTSATSLRKQNSTLPCKRPKIRGSEPGPFSPSMATGTLGHPWPADVSYRHCAKDGAFGGHPAP